MKNSLNGTRYLYRRIILNDSYRQSLNNANFLYVLGISSFVDIGIYDVSNNHNHSLHDSDNDKYYNHRMSDFETPRMPFRILRIKDTVKSMKELSYNFET